MTDYVYSATAATRDTYALQDVPARHVDRQCGRGAGLRAEQRTPGAGSLGLTVKSGATTNEGTAQSLTTTAAYRRQLYETDPDTSDGVDGRCGERARGRDDRSLTDHD